MKERRTLINTAIVIAARNEAGNISEVVQRASQYGNVIVVDDASVDMTARLAVLAGATVMRHCIRTHIRRAFVDGFQFALKRDYKRIVQIDAGLSHDPDEIPKLLQGLDEAAMVIGSRYLPGARSDQKYWRRLLSRGGTFLTGLPFTDVTSGFRAYDASLLNNLNEQGVLDNLRAKAHAFQFELLWQITNRGYPIKEVPITYRAGRSSLRIGTVIEALRVLARLRCRGD